MTKKLEEKEEKQTKAEISTGIPTENLEKSMLDEEFFEYELEDQGETFKLWSVAFGKKHQKAFESNGVKFKEGDINFCKIYLYDEILEPKHYVKLFELIRSIPVSIITIYINSPGGDISTLITFCSILDELREDTFIITVNDGQCASAGAILLCAGDEICFSEFSTTMFHNVSLSFVSREQSSVFKTIGIYQKQYKMLLETYASKLLTKKEINDILERGFEIHLLASECGKRLKRWEKKMDKAIERIEAKKQQEEQAKEEPKVKPEAKEKEIQYMSQEVKEHLEYYEQEARKREKDKKK